MLNTLKIILSCCSRGSQEPPRSPSPHPEARGWWRDRDLGGGWPRGARLHLRCRLACGGSGKLPRTARPSGKVAGFLAVAVFVFWALRDSVLAPNGCSLPLLNFVLFFIFFPSGELGKKTAASRRVASRHRASGSRGPCTGRGEKQTAPARVPTCETREGRRAPCGPGWGARRGRRGRGRERESFVSDFADADCEVGWICNLWLSSREWEPGTAAAAAAARGGSGWGVGNRLRSRAAGAGGHPAAGCSDRGQGLENCGLRCLSDAVVLELWRKIELVLLVLKLPPGKQKHNPVDLLKHGKDPLRGRPFLQWLRLGGGGPDR